MTAAGPIEALKQLRFPEAEWGPADKPVAVVDGVVHRTMRLGDKDTAIVGSRRPLLDSRTDGERIARYQRDFERLRRQFAAEPPD